MQNSAAVFVTQGEFASLAEHLLEKIKQNNADLAEQILKRLNEIRHGEAADLNNSSDDQFTSQNTKKRRYEVESGLVLSEEGDQDNDEGDHKGCL
jgi:hypothetical protein